MEGKGNHLVEDCLAVKIHKLQFHESKLVS